MENVRPYRYTLAPTTQFYFCGIPFRLDTTPKCDLGCLYCFASSRGGKRTPNELIVNLSRFARKMERAFKCSPQELDVSGQMLQQRVPIHFGGMSDPFTTPLISDISRELLRILTQYDYPVIMSTKKTDELTKDETLQILQRTDNRVIQISFSTLNEELASRIEPNAPSPQQRLKSISVLSGLGVFITVRLQPLFPALMDEAIEEIIPAVAEAGARHVIVEFLKLPVEKNVSLVSRLCKLTKWKHDDFFQQKKAQLVGREWILPNQYKWDALQPIIRKIREQGMTYGAGDYALHHLGDTACCCGIDKLPGFTNWLHGNFANVIRETNSEYIKIDRLESYWLPDKSIRAILNSHSRLANKRSMLDYLKAKWNSPGTANAPDAFLGVSWKGDYDDSQNCIYIKEQNFVLPKGH